MQEPKFHSKIVPMLPEGHWLEEYFDALPDGGEPRLLRCNECGFVVYDKLLPEDPDVGTKPGTQITWFETGWVFPDHPSEDHPDGDPTPYTPCCWCFGHQDGQNGTTPTRGEINPAFALNDDGSPQDVATVGTNNVVPYERLAGQPPLPKEYR